MKATGLRTLLATLASLVCVVASVVPAGGPSYSGRSECIGLHRACLQADGVMRNACADACRHRARAQRVACRRTCMSGAGEDVLSCGDEIAQCRNVCSDLPHASDAGTRDLLRGCE